MTQVQVTRKELSNGLQTILVTLNGQEGMLTGDLANLLNVTGRNIRQLCADHNLNIGSVGSDVVIQLKKQNVIALNAARIKFLPRETVEALVKLVGTSEAWTIYGQLWSVVRSVYSGDLRKASLDVGLSEDDTLDNLEKALKLARQYKAERDAAMTLIKTQKAFAANHAAIHGLRSVDVLTKYPEGSTALIEETKPKIKNVEAFGPTGILTTGLKRHGLKAKVWTANKSGTKVALFNAEEVETFMSKYKGDAK